MGIRLLLVDDVAMVRAALKAALVSSGEVEIVGEAATGEEALSLARVHAPDVVLLDVGLPGLPAVDIVRELKAHRPACRVVVCTGYDRAVVEPLLTAGADGWLSKTSTREVLLDAVRGTGLSADAVAVLTHFAQGATEAQIARAVGLPVGRVAAIKSESMRALGLKTRAAVLRHAIARGWLSSEG